MNTYTFTKQNRSFPGLIFFITLAIGAALAYTRYTADAIAQAIAIGIITVIAAYLIAAATQVTDQWNRAVILRLGKFRALKGPGLFFIIPILDAIPYWIDTRVITSGFKAEKTLTKDTVPVDVDAVLFWQVIDARQAALAVADYQSAISWASQTALRDVIGKTMLPIAEEFDRYNEVLTAVGSCKKAVWIFTQRGGAEALRQATEARRNDLLVYLALANLRRRVTANAIEILSSAHGIKPNDYMQKLAEALK